MTTIDGSEGTRTTFGQKVAINNDGTIVIIGSPYYNGAGTQRGVLKYMNMMVLGLKKEVILLAVIII